MEPTNDGETGEVNAEELLGLALLKIADLGRVVERLLEAELAGPEVSLAELRVLSVCAARPGITAVEVSRALLVDPPVVSRLVHPLAQRGLLSRRRSRTDRREVRLRVSDGGQALLAECQPLLEQAEARLVGYLEEAEQGSLRRAVATLLDVLVSPGEENPA